MGTKLAILIIGIIIILYLPLYQIRECIFVFMRGRDVTGPATVVADPDTELSESVVSMTVIFVEQV